MCKSHWLPSQSSIPALKCCSPGEAIEEQQAPQRACASPRGRAIKAQHPRAPHLNLRQPLLAGGADAGHTTVHLQSLLAGGQAHIGGAGLRRGRLRAGEAVEACVGCSGGAVELAVARQRTRWLSAGSNLLCAYGW